MVSSWTSPAGNAGPVYFQPESVTPRPAMADMFIFEPWVFDVVAPAAGDEPDIDIPDIPDIPDIDPPDPDVLDAAAVNEEDADDASADVAAGVAATANGARTRPSTAKTAPTGCSAISRAAGAGCSVRAGTNGRIETPMRAMMGPLLGSVPPKVSSSPSPCPVTQ